MSQQLTFGLLEPYFSSISDFVQAAIPIREPQSKVEGVPIDRVASIVSMMEDIDPVVQELRRAGVDTIVVLTDGRALSSIAHWHSVAHVFAARLLHWRKEKWGLIFARGGPDAAYGAQSIYWHSVFESLAIYLLAQDQCNVLLMDHDDTCGVFYEISDIMDWIGILVTVHDTKVSLAPPKAWAPTEVCGPCNAGCV